MKISKKFKILGIVLILILVISIFWFLYRTYYTQENIFTLDEDGIVWKDYGIKHGQYIGKHRNPVFAHQYSIGFYDQYIQTGNQTAKQFLLNNADWFLDNITNYKNYSIYIYNFPYPPYQMPEKGWVDAMTQGKIIMVLIKAHEVTNDSKYLDAADSLLNSFYVGVDNGGATYKTENGWWYEHYSHPDGLKPKVLNAHLFVLLDVYDYYNYTKNPKAMFIFEKGLESAINEIHLYDNNGHTWADRLFEPSRPNYHKIHIELTDRLYSITQEEVFKDYHEKWKNCDELCQYWNFFYNYGLRRLGLIG